jgi:hypothetical protein
MELRIGLSSFLATRLVAALGLDLTGVTTSLGDAKRQRSKTPTLERDAAAMHQHEFSVSSSGLPVPSDIVESAQLHNRKTNMPRTWTTRSSEPQTRTTP